MLMRRVALVILIGCIGLVGALGAVWVYAGRYGLHAVLRRGGSYWVSVDAQSARISPAMRAALAEPRKVEAGPLAWHRIATGFEVADLAVIADGIVVDHMLLARINSAHFRIEARNAPDGDKGLDEWMAQLQPALIVNGSYYAHNGLPDTRFVSNGRALGPQHYSAKAGAFIVGSQKAAVVDLAEMDWKEAFHGAENAMVSYPLLLKDGAVRVSHPSKWLANRSFVAQDSAGLLVIGTTTDAFFSLDRLARFLLAAPLDLKIALNLDGGPVASQAISLNGFTRRSVGRWETQINGDTVHLLCWPYGSFAMPVVIAVFPK